MDLTLDRNGLRRSSTIRLIRPHLSARSLATDFAYLQEAYPIVDLERISAKAGLPYSFVSNPNNFVTYRYQRDLMRELFTLGVGSDFSYQSGLRALKAGILDPVIFQQIRQIGSASAAYDAVGEFLPLFNALLKAHVTPVGPRQKLIRFWFEKSRIDPDDLPDIRECIFSISQNCRGYMAAVSEVFGCPRAEVDYAQFDPEELSFEFSVRFEEPNSKAVWFPKKNSFLATVGAIGGILGCFMAGGWLAGGLAAFLLWSMIATKRRQKKKNPQHDTIAMQALRSFKQNSDQYSTVVGFALDAVRSASSNTHFKKVAHDIRSPVFALQSIERSTDSIPGETRDLIRHTTQRIREIADDVLKQESPTTETDFASACVLYPLLNGVVHEKAVSLRPTKTIGFEVDRVDLGMSSKVVAPEFCRIISNLIDNGLEAMTDQGTLRVRMHRADDDVAIEIQDSGPGFPPEVLKDLGRPGISAGKDHGHGIGLSTAMSTVAQWGGRIQVQTSKENGSRVTVLLPKVEAVA